MINDVCDGAEGGNNTTNTTTRFPPILSLSFARVLVVLRLSLRRILRPVN